jgi:hypothetical protein
MLAACKNGLLIRLAALLLSAASAIPLEAQYTVGRLEGTIFDPTGAVVSGAKVTLQNLGTSATRTYITGPDGLYVFFALPAGDYELTAEALHFARSRREIQILTSETTSGNLTLAVNPQSATIEVLSEMPGLLNITDAQQSTTRTDLELSSLPSIGRNMISLIHLAPGVQPMDNPRGGSTFGGGGSLVLVLGPQAGLFSANGGRARSASVQLDYTDANDWEYGGFALGMQSVTPEMLQEFKLLTSNFSAEYGVKSNAEVIMVSKSGTNNLHGSAYDFVQNTLFNARDYFDTSGHATPVQSNVYGVSAGGPVIRNRTFLFGAYEGRRVRGNAFTTFANLPTEAARARASDLIIAALMNRYLPLPTINAGDPNFGQLVTKIPSPINTYQLLLKADHRLSAQHSLSARYLQSSGSFVARSSGQNTLPGFDTDINFALNNANLTDSYVLNMRTVNQLRLSYGYARALSLPQNGVVTPRFQIVGAFPLNFGALPINPAERRFNIYQVNDTLSHSRGGHILSMGFDVRRIQDHSRADTNTRGVFTFPALSNFLTGQPSSWTQLFGSTQRDLRTGVYSFFIQDDWKVRPTLTINLGARWELQGALNEAKGRISILDPALPGTIGSARPGPLGSFRLGGPAVDRNPFNVAPRLGFAWNPHRGNLVFRGGYGIYWDSFTFDLLTVARSAPPFNYQPSLSCAISGCQISGVNSFDNLVNGTAKIQSDNEAQLGTFGTLKNFGSVNTVNPQLRNPYVQQYSLGMEYQFGRSYMFGLTYIGSQGTHLTRLVPINPVNGPAPATSPADETTPARVTEFEQAIQNENGPGNKRLDPRFNQVNRLDDGASSNYNSLQVTGNKSFSHGLQFQASYTWSKSIDNASDFYPAIQANDNSYPQDASRLAAERAVSNFDIRHRIIVTGVWQVPFFRGQTGFAKKVLDGWSFESVNLWQSAVPATLAAGTRTVCCDINGKALTVADLNIDGNFISPSLDNTRPNCDPTGTHFTLGAPSAISGFSQPLLGNDGTCGRNTVRMNSLTNFDWSFFKDTELTESGPWGSGPWKLQFRAEMYNIFNTPFLTASGDGWRTITSSSFGTVNAAGISRKIQLALRLSW